VEKGPQASLARRASFLFVVSACSNDGVYSVELAWLPHRAVVLTDRKGPM